MANLTGHAEAYQGDTDATASVREVPLGTRARDTDGNEYIYLQGVASTAKFDAVTFGTSLVTLRSAANAKGRFAVAMSTTVASEFGWYQIYGRGRIQVVGTGGDEVDRQVYLTSTAGNVSTTDVAGDLVAGAFFRSNTAPASGTASIELNYPFCHDAAID